MIFKSIVKFISDSGNLGDRKLFQQPRNISNVLYIIVYLPQFFFQLLKQYFQINYIRELYLFSTLSHLWNVIRTNHEFHFPNVPFRTLFIIILLAQLTNKHPVRSENIGICVAPWTIQLFWWNTQAQPMSL